MPALFGERFAILMSPLRFRSAVAAVLALTITADTTVAETLAPPSGKRSERESAARTIPYSALRADVAREIHSIVDDAAMYRRLPVTSTRCDKDLFVFWARNPDVIVGVWQEMGVTQITLRRTGKFTFEASDGEGTTSGLELVYGTPNLHLYRGVGYYEGPLLGQKIRGDCVAMLRSEFRPNGSKVPDVISRMDVFVAIDQAAVEIAARTLQPLFVRYADINFVETLSFVERLSDAAIKEGDRFSSLAHRLGNVQPEVQYRFAELAAEASVKTR